MQTYSLLFYAKKTKSDPEFSAVYLRITIDGNRKELSTGRRIKTSDWNCKAGKHAGRSSFANSFNSFLESLRTKMFESYSYLLNNRKNITCETLMNKFLGIEERTVTLIEAFTDHNNQIKQLIGNGFAYGTWERYETSLRHTRQFLLWKYKITDIDVREINPAFISDYEFFLRNVRNCANNSAVKYIKNFQKIIIFVSTMNGSLKTRLQTINPRLLRRISAALQKMNSARLKQRFIQQVPKVSK